VLELRPSPKLPGTRHGNISLAYLGKSNGVVAERPTPMQLGKVEPQRIMYTEIWLWKEGYAPQQVWRAS